MAIDQDVLDVIDLIPVVDHTPQAHRDAINAILVGLGSDTRTHPEGPTDHRAEIPVLTETNIGEVVAALRQAAIRFGIGVAPE